MRCVWGSPQTEQTMRNKPLAGSFVMWGEPQIPKRILCECYSSQAAQTMRKQNRLTGSGVLFMFTEQI